MNKQVKILPTDTVIRYKANPTAARIHADLEHQIHVLDGPWGCGKSQIAIVEVRKFMQRHPSADFLVVRDTYSALSDSCVSQWVRTYGQAGTIVGSGNQPKDFRWHPDTGIKGVIKFRAAEDPLDVQKFLSADFGGAWIEEVTPGITADGKANKGIPPEIFAAIWARCRQIREEARLILTMAPPPSPKHWTFTLFYDRKPLTDVAKLQEAVASLGLDDFKVDFNDVLRTIKLWHVPVSENRHNLRAGYYESIMPLLRTPSQIKRFIKGEVGESYEGFPVYPTYNDALHRSLEVSPNPGPMLRGWDGGTNPACIWGQTTPSGELHILAELTGTGEGVADFADRAIAYGNELFGVRHYRDFGDETMLNRDQGSGKSAADFMRLRGIVLRPIDNNITKRIDAVRGWLTRLGIDGARFKVHLRCENLIEGLRGLYRFSDLGGQQGDTPKKTHPTSDLQDALQYLCLGLTIGDGEGIPLPPIAAKQVDRLAIHPGQQFFDNLAQPRMTRRGLR